MPYQCFTNSEWLQHTRETFLKCLYILEIVLFYEHQFRGGYARLVITRTFTSVLHATTNWTDHVSLEALCDLCYNEPSWMWWVLTRTLGSPWWWHNDCAETRKIDDKYEYWKTHARAQMLVHCVVCFVRRRRFGGDAISKDSCLPPNPRQDKQTSLRTKRVLCGGSEWW
jgi:hypothetical protein